uniref:chorismate mutase n=2 Tax=Cacopsylla melanoneura TaxID=428564 RepID=A0A8D9ERC7_9HEMI
MAIPRSHVALVFLLMAMAPLMQSSVHCADPAPSKLGEIIVLIRGRLDLARDVAFTKLKTCKLIEDSVREAEILANATTEGTKQGLTKDQVSTFYKAQMEANKLIQYNVVALDKTLKDYKIKNDLIGIRKQLNELDAKILPLIKPCVTELSSSKSTDICLETVSKVVSITDPKTPDYYKAAVVRAAALFTETCLTAPICKSEELSLH